VAVFKKTYKLFGSADTDSAAGGGVSESHALERVDWRRHRDFPAVRVAGAIEQKRHEVVPRIDRPVAPEIVEELGRKFVDFQRAIRRKGFRLASLIRLGRHGER